MLEITALFLDNLDGNEIFSFFLFEVKIIQCDWKCQKCVWKPRKREIFVRKKCGCCRFFSIDTFHDWFIRRKQFFWSDNSISIVRFIHMIISNQNILTATFSIEKCHQTNWTSCKMNWMPNMNEKPSLHRQE